MKVIIEGRAHFKRDNPAFREDGDEGQPPDVDVVLCGHPEEDLPRGAVLLVHPDVSLEVDAEELARALRPFVRAWGGR